MGVLQILYIWTPCYSLLCFVGKLNMFTFKVINSQISFEALPPPPAKPLLFGHELGDYKVHPVCEDLHPSSASS